MNRDKPGSDFERDVNPTLAASGRIIYSAHEKRTKGWKRAVSLYTPRPLPKLPRPRRPLEGQLSLFPEEEMDG